MTEQRQSISGVRDSEAAMSNSLNKKNLLLIQLCDFSERNSWKKLNKMWLDNKKAFTVLCKPSWKWKITLIKKLP